MRTAITILTLILAATGCITDQPAESETTSDLTLNYSSPTLGIVVRIASMRRSADDLRAVLAATKAPVNPTWTVYLKYRSFTTFLKDSADALDTMANDFQVDADAAVKEAAKIAVYEDIEMMMADMQDRMNDKVALEQYDLAPFTVQTTSVKDIIRRLLP